MKINRKEFAGLADLTPEAMSETRMPGLRARGGGFARASLGRHGRAAPHLDCGARHRAVFHRTAADTRDSPTGSGDVVFAALLNVVFTRNESLELALRYALPLGTANAASAGVADFNLRPYGFVEK